MASFHVRSLSLPSASHPIIVNIQEQLYKLKASQSPSVGHRLSGLKNLLECVDDLLQLPICQHNLQSQCVEEALNGSLQLLDTCNAARDFYSQMKESAKELELSLRRRKGNSSFTSEVEASIASRKKLNKVICKFLRNLRRKERKCKAASLENNSDSTNIICILREVEEISISVFESILSFISQPMPKSKASGWSLVSKLLQSKHAHEGEVEANEMEKIEKQLLVLISSKDMELEQVQNVAKGLIAMGSSFQQVEQELERVYRRLVKTRVFLLNILNN